MLTQALGIIAYIVPTRALISQVEREIRRALDREGMTSAEVISTPGRDYIKQGVWNVLVFTQERLHILLTSNPKMKIDLLVVDEAHKIGDSNRGVLLQQVIEDLVLSNPQIKVILSSPMSSNPEDLIADAPAGTSTMSLTSDEVTVSQNLIWATQLPRTPIKWKAQLLLNGRAVDLGKFDIGAQPVPPSKRLPFVAAAIGGGAPGNVIYVNGAGAAETAATQLYDLLDDINTSAELDDLIALSHEIVHPQFLLQKVLRRGIAFHYGNLPQILRVEIERLFTSGKIRYLICTSTLVEGVNMSCRNIFIRGPKRGKAHPMTQEDFWNLAGRAGRWGKEFQGNIVCVDASDPEVWGSGGAPKDKAKYIIRRATDSSMQKLDALTQYIEAGAPSETRKSETRFEATFSYLCNLQATYGTIGSGPWARRYPAPELHRIESAIREARSRIETPAAVIQRNPGISPFAMDALLTGLRGSTGPDEGLLPSDPGSNDAVESYAKIFGRCAQSIAPSLSTNEKRQLSLAILVTHWMRGYPLSRLIIERINVFLRRGEPYQVANVIRTVMEDVEQAARFEAPRVMACYRDLVQVVLTERGRLDLVRAYPDLSLFLEFGVAQQTQISLITSGLSRTSTIAISEIISSDSLSKQGVLDWLVANERVWRESSLPILVKREVEALLPRREHQ
jgi:hypothetical protein